RLSGRCVECRTTADCAGASRCVDHRCQASPSCSSDLDCTSMSLVCDLVGHRCAECNSAADCMEGACLDHTCYASKACTSSLDCRDLRSVCGPALPPAWPTAFAGMGCVDCVSAADCGGGRFGCTGGLCADECQGKICGMSPGGASCGSCGPETSVCLGGGAVCLDQVGQFFGNTSGAIDGGDEIVVWDDGRSGSARLVAFNKSSGATRVVSTNLGGNYIDGVAENSAAVYFSRTDGSIRQRPRSGGAESELAHVTSSCWHLVADESFVYCALRNYDNSAVDGLYKIPVAGGSATPIDLVGIGTPDELVLGDGRVYWAEFNASMIGYTDLGSGHQTILSHDQGQGLQLIGPYLYYRRSSDDALVRMATADGNKISLNGVHLVAGNTHVLYEFDTAQGALLAFDVASGTSKILLSAQDMAIFNAGAVSGFMSGDDLLVVGGSALFRIRH
ncbi:MAG: hypothetical protein U1E65_23390, partial [Myxococcota bacterium]